MSITTKIFELEDAHFEYLAFQIFRYQYSHIPVYREFSERTGRTPNKVKSLRDIPFLPVRFFKTHKIKDPNISEGLVFESSGTTGLEVSRHFISDPGIYKKSFLQSFQIFYENPSSYCILGLLPSYLERESSSLVYMVDELIRQSNNEQSGFYLNEFEHLLTVLKTNEANKQPTLLIGVTYALLDFFEQFPITLQYTQIVETGGMKGRRQELTRPDVHFILKKFTGLPCIHSEYGMTELCSQAWSACNGIFYCPPWMKMGIRAEDDPFDISFPDSIYTAKTGVANIIDLANINSCSFIAVDDLAKLNTNGSFEILGRVDNSDIRGCSLLYADGIK